MQPISRTRLFIVAFVTIVSLWVTYPTARYYLFLRQEAPKPTAPKPLFTTPPPPKSEAVAYANWAEKNPEYAKWLDQKQNQQFLDWEAKSEALRGKAIPLGLDLIGGVDVTLALDREKAVITQVNNLIDSLSRRFDVDKIGATFDAKGEAIAVKLANPNDAQRAANTIGQQLGNLILDPPTADELAKGQPVTIALNKLELNRAIETDVEGARRGISERVDALGVTQPRISRQGTDRIRVQVPGERDPDRLLRTVIQPAHLEFRLVDPRNEEILTPDGKIKPGAIIPPGTELVTEKQGKLDKATRKMAYTESQILVNKKAELTGKDLRSASVQILPEDPENPIQVSLNFKDEGATKFAELTGANVGKRLAILLDGVVRSAPVLNERIPEGRATIRGGFSQEEAQDLTQILKAGALPAPLKIESKRTVGATMGIESIFSGVKALAWGSAIIIVIMIAYYGTAGAIAVVGLLLNAIIILALMGLSKATLTLSGIGGILLTVGMAVDANILIYERMREELRSGKPLKQALGLGFNRAFSAILDSNLTTLLSALVLLQFTEGSVFGFALTMAFGLVANLFTGLTVTYTLCGLWFEKFGHLSLGKFAILQNPKIDFIKMRWLSWSLSTGLLLAAVIGVFAVKGGIPFGVDFEGGYRAELQFNQKIDETKVVQSLTGAGLKDVNVQKVTNLENFYIIDMKALPSAEGGDADLAHTQTVFETAIKKAFPGEGAYKVQASSGFGPQTSQEFRSLAIWVTLLSALSILGYLWFRFELVFGVAAVISLLHDLIIVFFLAVLLGVQVNLEVVAAMMVLMGLSVNDTIVIFDRIRENTRAMAGKSFGEICNSAMNQTLSRTVMTSGGVIIAAGCLLFIGGEGLQAFATIYLIGIFCGTYSSDFIAAPILYQWNKYKGDHVRQMLATQKKKKEAAKPIRQNV